MVGAYLKSLQIRVIFFDNSFYFALDPLPGMVFKMLNSFCSLGGEIIQIVFYGLVKEDTLFLVLTAGITHRRMHFQLHVFMPAQTIPGFFFDQRGGFVAREHHHIHQSFHTAYSFKKFSSMQSRS